ncbi:glucosaminidase domain-containing protein [Sphingobacterium hungaricum]|uniref:Hemagglutinin n=1 Tax=Sphingobacterium hungaricum TaxID=2082723 RepID=A0A928UU26_9SPHI|nr:glucosaminidase domain-containing protein [Sphingobacterium hungaricum]MBE8712898.1 hemagglutinin [Sphingobacterium hungaricum]
MLKTCRNLVVVCLILTSTFNVSFGQKFSPTTYIEEHKEVAQQLMKETGVPASVILAVAIHESAYGNSKIAKYLNNHFGIKGKNNSKSIKSAYKGYGSVLESYRDFVGLLQRRKSTQPLFQKQNNDDFDVWIKGIARSGYSQSSDWSRKVTATIEHYDLDQYDKNSGLN